MLKLLTKKRYQSLINELESVKKENELLKKDPVSFEDLKQKRDFLLLQAQQIGFKIRQINSTYGKLYDRNTHRKLIKN